MSKQIYEPGKTEWIEIGRCDGNLLVKGWADSRIAVQGNHETGEVEGMMTITSNESLAVWLPAGASLIVRTVEGDVVVKGVRGELQIETVMGDLVLKGGGSAGASVTAVHGSLAVRGVDGPLQIGTVHGDAAFRNADRLQIERVHGDLAARYVEQDVQVTEVYGDISLHTVSGDVEVAHAHGDASLGNLGGLLNVEQGDGDIRLRGGLSAGKHHLKALGNIVVRWPGAEPLAVHATAASFSNRLPLQELDEQQDEESGKRRLSGQMGDGETVLVMDAGGNIVLKATGEADWETDFEAGWAEAGVGAAVDLTGLAEQISGEISARMAELSARMEERFGGDFPQRMAEKAARKAEQAMSRAARHAARHQRRANEWYAPPAPPASPEPPKARRKQPTAEEQVKILSMLEKGIISVEEAETLLSALEG